MLASNLLALKPPETHHFSSLTVGDPDNLRFTSSSLEANNEKSLESPVMKGSLPNSRCSAEDSFHKIFQILLGGFRYSKEFLDPSFHPDAFVLGKAIVSPRCVQILNPT